MKTLLPAIYLANQNQMIKEAGPAAWLGRMAGAGVRGAGAAVNAGIRGADATISGVNRFGLAAARGAQAVPGMISRMPGQIARGAGAAGGAIRHGFQANVVGPMRNAGLSFNANYRQATGQALSRQQSGLLAAEAKRRAAYEATPWMNRAVGMNTNGLAALAGTGAVGAGANAWINHQAGDGWGSQLAGMAPNFQMPAMQSPVQFRSPFKTASWTDHWHKQAYGAGSGAFRAAGALARNTVGAASKAAPELISGAGLPGMSGATSWMRSLHPKAQAGLDWLKATGPGQWAQKNPALAGGIAGAGLMRGGEYARNTIRENRIANLSPMERLMMAGGLIFNPQGVASRLY